MNPGLSNSCVKDFIRWSIELKEASQSLRFEQLIHSFIHSFIQLVSIELLCCASSILGSIHTKKDKA